MKLSEMLSFYVSLVKYKSLKEQVTEVQKQRDQVCLAVFAWSSDEVNISFTPLL